MATHTFSWIVLVLGWIVAGWGQYSFFQALVVPLDDEPFMITRMLEESNVHARTWVEETRPYPDTGDAIQMLVESLREFGLTGKNIGYEDVFTKIDMCRKHYEECGLGEDFVKQFIR